MAWSPGGLRRGHGPASKPGQLCLRGTPAQRGQQPWASHPPPPAPNLARSPRVTPEALLNWKGPLDFSHYFLVLLESGPVTVGVSWVLGHQVLQVWGTSRALGCPGGRGRRGTVAGRPAPTYPGLSVCATHRPPCLG